MIDGDAVVHELVLNAPRHEVFPMFVDAEQLVRWIGIDAELEARPGGRFRFEVMPGQFCEGTYVEVTPPTRVVFSWGWTDPAMGLPPGSSRVEVDLIDVGDQTHLRLVHHQLPGELRLLHDDGWHRFLGRLQAASEGREVGDHPVGDPAQRRAELLAESNANANADENEELRRS